MLNSNEYPTKGWILAKHPINTRVFLMHDRSLISKVAVKYRNSFSYLKIQMVDIHLKYAFQKPIACAKSWKYAVGVPASIPPFFPDD